MADIKDILSASASKANVAPRPPPSATKTNPPSSSSSSLKSDVPRELLSLKSEFNWSNQLALAPVTPINIFKAKRVKAVSWKLMPIQSSARQKLTGKVRRKQRNVDISCFSLNIFLTSLFSAIVFVCIFSAFSSSHCMSV